MVVLGWEKLHNCHKMMKLTKVNQIKLVMLDYFFFYRLLLRTPCDYTMCLDVKCVVAVCKHRVFGCMPTLVLACIGAPWSRRISIILPWPFLAAQ